MLSDLIKNWSLSQFKVMNPETESKHLLTFIDASTLFSLGLLLWEFTPIVKLLSALTCEQGQQSPRNLSNTGYYDGKTTTRPQVHNSLSLVMVA